MSGLDSRFIITSDLESLFRDKDTGEPLAGGIVTFYSDINRTTLKPVYQLTGSPPNYSYAALPNPCTLSAVGTFQDGGGNNIVPYYFPYTGTPADNTGVLELYYIKVQSSGLVLQFTREGWPNISASQSAENTELLNLIPNSQFWYHNNQPPLTTSGGLDIYPIAQGGWFLKRTTGGTSNIQINNSFELITTAVAGLNDYPRYSYTFKCSSFNASDTTRDLAIQWDDVYQFLAANPPGSQTWTLFFAAQSNDSNSYTFDLRLIHNFGTGGSPSAQTDTSLGSITITPSYSYYTVPITFPVISGTLGTNNDDYVALQLRGPSSSWDVDVTDFALYFGTQTPSFLNVQTLSEMKSEGIAGFMPIPNPDGSDLYLPLVLTPEGLTFDQSSVGSVVGKFQISPISNCNELLMDGGTYIYSDHHPVTGIPYSRLANYLILNSPAVTIGTSTIPSKVIPMFGTGFNFVTVLKNVDPTKFDLNMNISSGSNSVNDQTSGFTHTSADPLYVFTVTGVPTAGLYFSFTPDTGGSLDYNVWFSVDGSGTAPATPTGANIEVSLVTGDTIATTITKILTAVNQYQFMIVDARGYFWRGLDTGTTIDPNSATRTVGGIKDNGVVFVGAYLGSKELAAFASHTHTGHISGEDAAGGAGQFVRSTTTQDHNLALTIDAAGGSETRPINLALNWFIRY